MFSTFSIEYRITLPDESKENFALTFDSETIQLIDDKSLTPPEWTALDFHQCGHCPLSVHTSPHCPLAKSLVPLVTKFESLLSYDQVSAEIVSNERIIKQSTSAQRAISSLMGLVIATSGCPHTAYFRPMARFHLPFASEEETIYRATSMYLLAQYFRKKEQGVIDLELSGLKEIYDNIQVVNISTVNRLRSASKTDSTLNAIIILDVFAKTLPDVIEESLEEIEYLFTSFLSQ